MSSSSKHRKQPVVVVTGAGRPEGIGVEVARQLATRGMRVVITARHAETARARAGELAALGLDVVGEELDVVSDASVARFHAWAERELGRIDVLVNNAAATAAYGERPSTVELARVAQALEATLFGTWRTTRALLPLLARSAHPRVVNVSSGAGSHADTRFGLTTDNPMGPAYAVAKAALNAFTAALAHELAPTPIVVNAVCPGFTATFPGGAEMGARPVRDGAAGVVWAALLPDDGPCGGFFRDGVALGW